MDTFNVLGFSCSPRRNSNTDILVRQVLDTIVKEGGEVEFVKVSDLKILPCDGCWKCADTEQCHIEDDMQGMYPKLLRADGIVIGSPVHMGFSVSGHAQVFFDRTFPLWHKKKMKNKVGGCVVSSNRRGGISALRVINGVFFAHRIIIAGHANGYGKAPGEIREDKRALHEAAALGTRICELLGMLRKV